MRRRGRGHHCMRWHHRASRCINSLQKVRDLFSTAKSVASIKLHNIYDIRKPTSINSLFSPPRFTTNWRSKLFLNEVKCLYYTSISLFTPLLGCLRKRWEICRLDNKWPSHAEASLLTQTNRENAARSIHSLHSRPSRAFKTRHDMHARARAHNILYFKYLSILFRFHHHPQVPSHYGSWLQRFYNVPDFELPSCTSQFLHLCIPRCCQYV